MNTWDSLSRQVKDKSTGVIKSTDTRPVRDVYAQGMMAPQYSALTFPVAAGAHCIYEGELYAAKQAIATSEAWTAAHWDKVQLGAEVAEVGADVADLKSQINNSPTIKESNANGVDLDISDQQGNVLVRLKGGHIQTKNFNSNTDGNIITVASSGADYTTVRAAVEAAETAGASADNPYTIQIAPGSYNILSEFTSSEIAEASFYGLYITDGITLKGMGILREETVLYAEMNTSTYDQTKRNNVSTINLSGNYCALKNLTVKSKNMRYAVHDDTGSAGNATHIMENCVFYAETTTSGGYGNISYGAGTDGGKTFIFRDCDFGDLIHIHTGTQARSNLVIMERCRAYGLTATDYPASVDNHYYIHDSVFQWVNIAKATNWAAQHIFIKGSLLNAMVGGWSGMQYETGDTQRYQHPNIAAYPRAVTMESSGRQRIKATATADATIGICYYYDSANDIAFVQHSGYICTEVLGFGSADVGQYLNVGSGGALSLSSSATNAVGKVVCVNNAGQHFIKLSI